MRLSMRSIVSAFLVAVLLVGGVWASIGGDVSTAVTPSQWSCAATGGWSFTIVRAYVGDGNLDPNFAANLRNAKAAGINYRDVYARPCLAVDPFVQVLETATAVGTGNYGTLWFFVDNNANTTCGWSLNKVANCNFLESMINEGIQLGITMGVYTSESMWSAIMGNCNAASDAGLPLWYAHWDGNESFGDFTTYGGWYSPAMKQDMEQSTVATNCGFSARGNWYPS